ncbi:archaetidylserine decarboxylase [Nannocystaceae bacterium ST9]
MALIERSPQWSAMAASRAMGAAARLPLPKGLGRAAVDVYTRMFGVDLGEVDPELIEQGFPTFDAFFTRTLRPGAREVDKSPDVMISPCDGRLREVSEIEPQGTVIAKGHTYTLGELLADAELAERFRGGRQTVIYLHPRDYHRVHVPCSGMARSVTAIPGRLLPVTDASVAHEPRLFAVNERMIHVIDGDRGCVAVVMVAAFGVGHMSCAYHDLEPHPDEEVRVEFERPPFLAKGEELGVFHLGSTVVLLSERGFGPAEGLSAGGRVEFGQALLRWEGTP